MITKVNGVTFGAGLDGINEGDAVTIAHAPMPEHPEAMAVLHHGNRVGYLPKETALWVLSRGVRIADGVIDEVKIFKGRPAGLRVCFTPTRETVLS